MSIPRLPSVKTLCARHVQEIPFEMLSGNCQSYAKDRQIAINPVAQMPAKTTFHELAHIELGHTTDAVHDSESIPRTLTRLPRDFEEFQSKAEEVVDLDE